MQKKQKSIDIHHFNELEIKSNWNEINIAIKIITIDTKN